MCEVLSHGPVKLKVIFFFKQKTAYEIPKRDWSSDVCSSDLYGNYIPRASHRICDFITEGRLEDAKKIERIIGRMQVIINEGHPTYGHQCYAKALAAAAGYPVGDVRAPLTTFKTLGKEGEGRVKKLKAIMRELDELMDRLDGPAARPIRAAAE